MRSTQALVERPEIRTLSLQVVVVVVADAGLLDASAPAAAAPAASTAAPRLTICFNDFPFDGRACGPRAAHDQ
ncbi:hypothetical protein DMB42_01100 [Nonomuraea sp. WAC 01424]|nr:hypothetical protein DMB42_01100 [Nonomuraea sp. WAC 01424]